MSITEFFLRRRAILWFLLTLFVVGGVWAFTKMGKKEDSTFVIKTAVVMCPYAGATPYEVEQLISEPVARELQTVRRVKKVTSESYYGLSKIMVELESGTRSDEIPQLWDELRRKAMNVSSQLPEGAGPIQVNDDFGDVYGLYFALVADDEFEWDDAVAGELYREGQARVLICNIVKVPTETVHSEPIRAFVKVNKAQSNGTYHNIQTVMEDDYLKAQLFMAAQRDMDAFIRKYHNLAKLAGVINAMRLVS